MASERSVDRLLCQVSDVCSAADLRETASGLWDTIDVFLQSFQMKRHTDVWE